MGTAEEDGSLDFGGEEVRRGWMVVGFAFLLLLLCWDRDRVCV